MRYKQECKNMIRQALVTWKEYDRYYFGGAYDSKMLLIDGMLAVIDYLPNLQVHEKHSMYDYVERMMERLLHV